MLPAEPSSSPRTWRRQPALQRVRSGVVRRRRFEHFDIALHAAGGRQPVEPCAAREIVAARQHRRGRRHQPRLQPDQRAFCHGRRRLVQRNVDADLARLHRLSGCACASTRRIRSCAGCSIRSSTRPSMTCRIWAAQTPLHPPLPTAPRSGLSPKDNSMPTATSAATRWVRSSRPFHMASGRQRKQTGQQRAQATQPAPVGKHEPGSDSRCQRHCQPRPAIESGFAEKVPPLSPPRWTKQARFRQGVRCNAASPASSPSGTIGGCCVAMKHTGQETSSMASRSGNGDAISPSGRHPLCPSPTGFLHIGNARTGLFQLAVCPSSSAARRCCGSRIPTRSAPRRKRSTSFWTGSTGSASISMARPVYQSRAGRPSCRSGAMKLLACGQGLQMLRHAGRTDADARAAAGRQAADALRRTLARPRSVGSTRGCAFHRPPQDARRRRNCDRGCGSGPRDGRQREIDDFILLRADGTPTYMLAVVVDDMDMGCTHIIRGDDHLNNAFRQIQVIARCACRAIEDGWERADLCPYPADPRQ